MRQAWAPCDVVRTRVEREVEVGWVDLLGFIPRLGSDRPHISRELGDPVVLRGEPVHEASEEVRKGYAATWTSWFEKVGIHGVDDGWRNSWKGIENVSVFYGVGYHQHWGDLGAVNG